MAKRTCETMTKSALRTASKSGERSMLPSGHGMGRVCRWMRPTAAYCLRMMSTESNSDVVERTRGVPGSALSTVRRPWPAETLGTMQSGRGAPMSCAMRARCCCFFLLPWLPCVAELCLPVLKAFAEIVFGLVERTAERVVCEIDAGRGERAREERKDVAAQRIFGKRAGAEGGDCFGNRHSLGASVRESSRGASVREANSSGKKVSSSAWRRKPTPEEPPVPRRKPMMRSTVLR